MKTIREQLSNEVEVEDEQEVTISLGIAEPEIAPMTLVCTAAYSLNLTFLSSSDEFPLEM